MTWCLDQVLFKFFSVNLAVEGSEAENELNKIS